MATGVPDADLLKAFREIGEASIRSLMLNHFRKELKNPLLAFNWEIFPRFPNLSVIPTRLNSKFFDD